MTTLEYMKRQLEKHRDTYCREVKWNAPEEQLHNIERKIKHYEEAIAALEKMIRKEEPDHER